MASGPDRSDWAVATAAGASVGSETEPRSVLSPETGARAAGPARRRTAGSTTPLVVKADLTTAHFERFIDAKFDGTILTVAGITRDRRLVRGTYDRTLKPQQLVELGSDVEATEPILYSTVFVLLALTFLLNLIAIVIRSQMRARLRRRA